jgi:hypothetical protein
MRKFWLLLFCITTLSGSVNTANASAHAAAERAMKFPATPASNCAALKKTLVPMKSAIILRASLNIHRSRERIMWRAIWRWISWWMSRVTTRICAW